MGRKSAYSLSIITTSSPRLVLFITCSSFLLVLFRSFFPEALSHFPCLSLPTVELFIPFPFSPSSSFPSSPCKFIPTPSLFQASRSGLHSLRLLPLAFRSIFSIVSSSAYHTDGALVLSIFPSLTTPRPFVLPVLFSIQYNLCSNSFLFSFSFSFLSYSFSCSSSSLFCFLPLFPFYPALPNFSEFFVRGRGSLCPGEWAVPHALMLSHQR